MKNYYGDLARSCLTDAEKKISSAQEYLRQAETNEILSKDLQKILNAVRKLSDRILDVEKEYGKD